MEAVASQEQPVSPGAAERPAQNLEEVTRNALESLRQYIESKGGVLPDGYTAEARVRQGGATQDRVDMYFYGPDSTKYRSRTEVARALGLEAPKERRASGASGSGRKASGTSKSSGKSVGKRPSGQRTSSDDGAPDNAAGQLIHKLQVYIEGEGGELGPGWRAEVKLRSNGTRAGSYDAYYVAPDGSIHRSRLEVARALGLAAKQGQALPPSPGVDVDMPDKDVAVMLMELYQSHNGTKKKRQKTSGAAGGHETPKATSVQSGSQVVTPKHRTPADANAPVDTSALAAMAEASERMSPLHPRPPTNGMIPPSAADREAAPPDGNVPITMSPSTIFAPPTGRPVIPGLPVASPRSSQAHAANGASPNGSTGGGLLGNLTGVVAQVGLAWGFAQKADLSAENPGSPGLVTIQASSNGLGATAADNQKENRKRGRSSKNADTDAAADGQQPAALEGGPARRPRRDRGRPQVNYGMLDTLADVQYSIETAEEKKRVEGEAEQKQARKARKQAAKETCGSTFSKLLGRVRAQISRIRQEELLIQTYEADGWRGGNREKFKPTAEVERARQQIQKSTEVIRDAVKYCEESEGDKPLPQECFDENGEIEEENICCSKCHSPDSVDGNDIVLCDGNCNRAYHEKCVVPPFVAADLDEDAGWLCPGCDTKVDIIDLLNEEFNTEYHLDTPSHDILAHVQLVEPPVAAGPPAPGGASLGALGDLLHGQDLPESDPEDSDFRGDGGDEEGGEVSGEAGEGGSEAGSDSSGSSESGGGSNSDTGEAQSMEEGEEVGAEGTEGAYVIGRRTRGRTGSQPAGLEGADEGGSQGGIEEEAGVVLTGKRRRAVVDYKLLNALVFGDAGDAADGEEASDEDFAVGEDELRRVNSG